MKAIVVGLGSVGRRHVANLQFLGISDIIGVSEHRRLETLSSGGVHIPVLHTFDEALGQKPQIAVIANPSAMHSDYAGKALAAGCHVYLEKPIAMRADDVPKLIDLAVHRGCVVAVGTQKRFNRQLLALRDHLPEVGPVQAVEAHLGENVADYHPGEEWRESYTVRPELGGGVLLTQIHEFDYLTWLFGPFEALFAIGGTQTSLAVPVEDSVSLLMRSNKGVPVYVHLDYFQRPKYHKMSVLGEGGRIEWSYFDNSLSWTPSGLGAVPETSRPTFDRNQMFVDCLADFLEAVRSRRPPRSTLQDGLASLRLVDAAKRSLSTGKMERLGVQ